MENQKTLRKKLYEFVKSKGAVLTQEDQKTIKAIMTEYKHYFLSIEKEPPVAPATKYKETWHDYSP